MKDSGVVGGLSAVVVGALALAGVLIVVLIGWQVGWWFTVQNAKRQGQIINIQTKNIRQGQGYQSNLATEIDGFFGNIQQVTAQIQAPDVAGSEVGALKAERYADLTQLCGDAAQVTSGTLDGQQTAFVSANCSNGAVSPQSIYAQP